MPRRKKAGITSQLPPLTFVNSPVFQPAPVLTPEYAADNPVTAKAVPVEDFTETTWVSPQFYSAYKIGRSSVGRLTRARHKSGGALKTTQPRQSKFRPLQFLSCAEVDKDSSVLLLDRSKQRRKSSLPKESVRKKVSKEQDRDFNLPEEMCELDIYTPVIRENNDIEVLGDNEKENVGDGNCDALEAGILLNEDNKLVAHSDSPLGRNKSSAHKGLLAPRNLFGTNISNEHSSGHIRSEGQESPPERRITRSRSLHNLPRRGEQHTNIFSSPSHYFEKEFYSCEDSPKAQLGNHKSVILAADTPECDYGLKFRQRQIKYYLRNRSVTSQ